VCRAPVAGDDSGVSGSATDEVAIAQAMSADEFYEVIDSRFEQLLNGSGRVERLTSGLKWAEGTAWFGGGRYLVWSDIPNNRMMRYDEAGLDAESWEHHDLRCDGQHLADHHVADRFDHRHRAGLWHQAYPCMIKIKWRQSGA